MAQSLLWSLLLCSFWSGFLWLASQWLFRRYRAFAQWPGVYWCLALLCFVPLLPMPELSQSWVIPSKLMQDTLQSVQQLTVQPLHKDVVNAPYPTEFVWQLALLVLAGISFFRLWRIAQQWRQLQQFITKASLISAAEVFGSPELSVAPQLSQHVELEIRQIPQAMSPFIAGWRKMVLVLPQYIWGMSATQRQLLIAHELVHLKRRDPQQLLLWRMLVALCWFNPVLRQLEQAFIRSMELTVDQTVLAAQPAQALLYGQTLLQSLKQGQAQSVPAGMPGFIQANAEQSFYQQRLTQLFQPLPSLSSRQRWLVLASLCGVGLLLKFGSAHVHMNAPLQDWRFPIEQMRISSFYAFDGVQPYQYSRPHFGIDLVAEIGAPIVAVQRGKVLIADDQSLHPRYGKVVLIDHGQGYQTLYAHLDQIQLAAGSWVEAGQSIGTVGETGIVKEPHLHFELLLRGQPQDPMLFLK